MSSDYKACFSLWKTINTTIIIVITHLLKTRLEAILIQAREYIKLIAEYDVMTVWQWIAAFGGQLEMVGAKENDDTGRKVIRFLVGTNSTKRV